ncbi:MFS transporter [Lysinibacillus sphaericus]|uniref:MFS transporter n=1 Tax=Lysinibacillus sphaericus TaxID=1421 RepID=A0A2S0JWE0_LYSSH|nr:MFS transporter [Lysinibacillus sphaericus]AVK95369.1 MFS transporter [Lysinibacillus sphaericus]MED4546260.1 MFS transporter [Lysinibacillus sphaericus]TKI19376.1 MFS transporter [Lysinibacillus sphaericus]UDK98472.1 MFS transporter [Lysinibacillus sphaericus]SUV19100.1 major facilitator superfamily protein [Lysinibacillus sphaericus]
MDKQNSKYRWVVFVVVLLTYLLMASQRTAPGLITDQLMSDFQVTAATIGLLTSIQFFVYTSLQVPMGILADRYGPNAFLILGATLTGIGTIIYSLSTHALMLFFSRILTGVGDATIWVNMVLILAQWFHRKEFVRLIGLAGMTGSLGFLLATVPFSTWIDLLGWRMAFCSAGLLLTLCGLVLYFVLVKKPKTRFINEQIFVTDEEQRDKTSVLLKRIFTNPQAWALFFCHFGVVGGYVGFISSWAVPYGMSLYEMTRSDASQLIMVGLIGALIGAPLTSWLASRLDTIKRPYIVVHSIVLLSWFTFLICNGHPAFFLLLVLFFIIGFGYGASALTFAAVRQSFPLHEAGVVSGFANTGGFLSAVLLPIIFGYLLDHFQSVSGYVDDGYYYGFIVPVLFSIIGLFGVLYFKEKRSI